MSTLFHDSMWAEASRDHAAETHERAVALASVALSGLVPFLHAASSTAEYDQRLALVADRVDEVLAAHTPDTLAHTEALAQVRADFEAALQSRVAARLTAALKEAADDDGLNTYVAIWRKNGKQVTVKAKTTYEAQQKAAAQFGAKKTYEVDVMLAQKPGGEQVVHNPAVLGAADNKPYGDVTYADPKNGKYPIDTEKHVRAAWSYINHPDNAAKYPLNGVSLDSVKSKIRSAAERLGIEISASTEGVVPPFGGEAHVAAEKEEEVDATGADGYDWETFRSHPDNPAAKKRYEQAQHVYADLSDLTEEEILDAEAALEVQAWLKGSAEAARNTRDLLPDPNHAYVPPSGPGAGAPSFCQRCGHGEKAHSNGACSVCQQTLQRHDRLNGSLTTVKCGKCVEGHAPDGSDCDYCDGAGSLDPTTAMIKAADGWGQGITAESFLHEAAPPDEEEEGFQDGFRAAASGNTKPPEGSSLAYRRGWQMGVASQHENFGRAASTQDQQARDALAAQWPTGTPVDIAMGPDGKPSGNYVVHGPVRNGYLRLRHEDTGTTVDVHPDRLSKRGVNEGEHGTDRYQKTTHPSQTMWAGDEWDKGKATTKELDAGRAGKNRGIAESDEAETLKDTTPSAMEAIGSDATFHTADVKAITRSLQRNTGHNVSLTYTGDAGVNTLRGLLRFQDGNAMVTTAHGAVHSIPSWNVLSVEATDYGTADIGGGSAPDREPGILDWLGGIFGNGLVPSGATATQHTANPYGELNNPYSVRGPGNTNTNPASPSPPAADPIPAVDPIGVTDPVTTRPRVAPSGGGQQPGYDPEMYAATPGDPRRSTGPVDRNADTTVVPATAARVAEQQATFQDPPRHDARESKIGAIVAAVLTANPGMDVASARDVAEATVTRYKVLAGV